MKIAHTFAAALAGILVFAFGGASSAKAQTSSPAAMEAIIDSRIAKLEREIADLKRMLVDQDVGGDGFPEGAVVAFRLLKCPIDWVPFYPASGRFILGVSEKHLLDASGGAEKHALSLNEMPSHDHGGLWGGTEGTAGMLNDFAYHTAGRKRIEAQGAGAPHNNMPPYYVLRWCHKGEIQTDSLKTGN